MRQSALTLVITVFAAMAFGCAGADRDAVLLDPADYPMVFDGAFLAGAAGGGTLEFAADGSAVLRIQAYPWDTTREGLLGPEAAFLMRGTLQLDAADSQDEELRFVVREAAEPLEYATIDTYIIDVDYRPVTGTVALSPAGELEAHLVAPREGTPSDEDEGYSWVLPPEMLDEVVRGPVTVRCAEGVAQPACDTATPADGGE